MGTNARKRRVLIKQIVFLVAIAAALYFGGRVWVQAYDDRDLVTLRFENGGKASPDYHVRVARTDAEREHGLMYVKPNELRGGKGMIFIFPAESILHFWMKDTPAPLDMVFINQAREVVGVVEQAHPFSTEPIAVGAQSSIVVELLGGTASKDGIVKGSKLVASPELPPAE